MTTPSTIRVTVPATTANLGPGFDCLGAALTLYNGFEFSRLSSDRQETLKITASGHGAEKVATDVSNLVYRAFAKYYHHRHLPVPAVQIAIHMDVPLARGLGSSATAIVGGLIGANELSGSPLPRSDLMALAIALEGHPDNVVPALLGGCQLTVTSDSSEPTVCPIEWHDRIVPVLAVPDFELSTAEARQVLPQTYSRADAIFNMAHLGLLVRGLETGRVDWLQAALSDRIHQPYRQVLIPGYDRVSSAALNAGAYGLVISGAGPTLLAFTQAEQTVLVEEAIAQAWKAQGIDAQVQALALDRQGASVSRQAAAD